MSKTDRRIGVHGYDYNTSFEGVHIIDPKPGQTWQSVLHELADGEIKEMQKDDPECLAASTWEKVEEDWVGWPHPSLILKHDGEDWSRYRLCELCDYTRRR